jgi:hypothetical protein
LLEETKSTYEELANMYVPDWQTRNKNDLVRETIEHKNDLSYDGYISAIMLRYWGKMTSYYHKCKLVISPEDAHTWLVQAVLYAVNRHPWTRPDSSIYEDKNGPDKVINRVIESKRLTFYQQLNRYNRKINSLVMSIESLSEDWADTNTPMVEDEPMMELEDIVMECFLLKDYFYAFLLDAIIYENYTLHKHSKKLVTHLQSIDDTYCDIFAGRYGLDYNKVLRASSYVTRMSRVHMNERMLLAPRELKRRFRRWGISDVDRID